MLVYVAIMMVAILTALLVVRLFRRHSTQDAVYKKKTVSAPVRPETRRHKQKSSTGLATSGARGKPADRTMSVDRRRIALVTGTIQKPWGW